MSIDRNRKVCSKREMQWELDGSLSRTQDQQFAGVLLDRARGECECRAKWHCVGSRLCIVPVLSLFKPSEQMLTIFGDDGCYKSK